MKIERTLLYCRFSRRYLGFREFQECVRIALEDEERLLYVGAIYQEVGEKFGVSASGVERNLRTVLQYAWSRGGKEPLEQLSGGTFYDKPTVSEVIEILVCYLKEHEER